MSDVREIATYVQAALASSTGVSLETVRIAEWITEALQASGLAIEQDWAAISTAPKPEPDATWDQVPHFLAKWPRYEDGEGSWTEHYSETWFAPRRGKFVTWDAINNSEWPLGWQPTLWKPLPATSDGKE